MSKPIIIDACTLSSVFIPKSEDHKEFLPVKEAIEKGKCVMVYGGKKYLKELTKVKSLRKLVNLMKKTSQIKLLNNELVDKEQKRIEELITAKSFNDPHLPAIAIVGNCHLICSKDKECMPHIKNRILYPNHFRPPRFYTRSSHVRLLYDKW